MGLIVWEGLSAFEHVQCTLLACGLPLVKSSLPCSLSPLSFCLSSQSPVSIFLTLRVCFLEVVVRVDATKMFSSCPHAGRYYCLTHCPYGRASSTGTVPVSASTVPVFARTIPSSLVLSHLPLLFAAGIVASPRLFLPRHGTSLSHHRRATLSHLVMASWL